MDQFLSFTILGLVTASIYAVAASGLVVTYTTSGIFNFAHGAVSMLGAFMYWQLSEGWGLPTVPSILLVLLVFAPLFGFVVERVVIRGLEGTSDVTKTVVTVGLLFGLIALAPIIWPPNRSRTVGEFFGGSKFRLFDAFVSYHQVTVIAVAIAVAIGLRLFLFQTRTGISMRAVVSNRQLVQLNGGRPSRASAMSWALGSSLAALAGILVADRFGLSVLALTFLVLNTYAAAIVGRLVSLPMTFVGAVILGLVQSYAIGYMPRNPGWLPDNVDLVGPLRLSIPVIMLFVVLLLLPQPPLRTHGLVRSRESVPQPTWRLLGIGAVVLIGGAFVASRLLSSPDVLSWSRGLGFAIIMLSLVPLTGYGGQISLAPMAFAGLGVVAMSQWGGDGTLLGLMMAFALPAVVGALVALPALRLQGIYLALATFAFAVFMERAVFIQQAVFPGGSRRVPRLALGPLTFEDDRAYMVLMAGVFAVLAAGVVALRLGPFGRRLQAMKDSPAACATLGLNLTVTKVQVFALSAGIAGVGGAMFGGLQQTVSVAQFEAIQSLPLVLPAVGAGIALVSGALVGGLLLASLPIIAAAVPALTNLLALAPGLIGIGLGRNPNGFVYDIATNVKALRGRRALSEVTEEPEATERRPFGLVEPIYDAETVGIDRPFTHDDLVLIDRMVHIREEEVAAGGTPRS
jgi:branched-chain amino acid transport system permease protein